VPVAAQGQDAITFYNDVVEYVGGGSDSLTGRRTSLLIVTDKTHPPPSTKRSVRKTLDK